MEELVEKGIPHDCADGEPCQKICSETELESLLGDSWHLVTALRSGKIVIER